MLSIIIFLVSNYESKYFFENFDLLILDFKQLEVNYLGTKKFSWNYSDLKCEILIARHMYVIIQKNRNSIKFNFSLTMIK